MLIFGMQVGEGGSRNRSVLSLGYQRRPEGQPGVMCVGQSAGGKRSEHTFSVASPKPRRVDEVGTALGAIKGFYQAVLFPTQFGGTQPLDNPHAALTVRTEPEGRFRNWRRRRE